MRGPLLLLCLLGACTPAGPLVGARRQQAQAQLGAGRWKDARGTCAKVLRAHPDDCAARYCELLAETMLFVDQVNRFVIPRYQTGSGKAGLSDLIHLWQLRRQLARATRAADETSARGCSFDLPRLPLRVGAPEDPLLDGEVRGTFTPAGAHLVGAILYSFRYLITSLTGRPPKVELPPGGGALPLLPEHLRQLDRHLAAYDRLLLAAPSPPSALRGGWHDRDGDGAPSAKDELLLDVFRPGTSERLFDFSSAEFVRGESLPEEPLTPTAALPPARCGYQRYHVDTILSGRDVGATDGMSFSPDGARLVLPMKKDGRYQLHLLGADGRGARCLTCGAGGSSDGVRWQPGGDLLLFVSDRDHPHALGSAGGGAGQELYAMRADGSGLTRLTRSPSHGTNYHPNWSRDGRRIVWGTTDRRTWDVMVADLVADARGARLENVRRLTHDTTWWETHGFSTDGKAVITSNSRAGLLSSDLYAIDLDSGRRRRLTAHPAWDEHGHLSPDGRKLSWISGRFQPAAVSRLSPPGRAPLLDFFWIIPGIFFDFFHPPIGYATELTLADADGTHLQRLTADGEVTADNQWSPDGRRIVFRQIKPGLFSPARIRVLTFDDCR